MRWTRGPRASIRALAFGLASAFLLGLPGPSARAQTEASVAWSRDPQAVVARFVEEITELEDPDPGPSVTVYGDGRVLVHYPVYMKRAGDWELRLADAELEALLASLAGKLADFDEDAARTRATQVRRSRPDEVYRSSASTTRLDLRLERFRKGTAPERRDVDRKIAWRGLRADAQRLPGVPEIQDLDAARREMRALMERPELERVP